MYSGYRIAFHEKDEWSFDNDTAKNILICDVNNSLSSHADNLKNYFVVFGEANTFGINGSFGAPEEKLRACIMMLINVICLLMEKKYLNLKWQ